MENMDNRIMYCSKMSAYIYLGPKYLKYPKIYLPKLPTQAQKLGILMEKVFTGRS